MSSKRTADPPPDDRDRDRKRRFSSQSGSATISPLLPPAPPPDTDDRDRDRDRKKRRSSQFGSATAAPPLQPRPPPAPPLQPSPPPAPFLLPPLVTYRERFRSHSGHHGITIWKAHWEGLRPPLSFQIYLTFDTSDWIEGWVNAFAERLYYECTGPRLRTAAAQQQRQPHEWHPLGIRLDITMLGAVSEANRNVTCMQHYRMSRYLGVLPRLADDSLYWNWPPIPSCAGPNGARYTGFLIQINEADYFANDGLRYLFFDTDDADRRRMEMARPIMGPPPVPRPDPLIVLPTKPVRFGVGNLWSWDLCHVWETMAMVKQWGDRYYQRLNELNDEYVQELVQQMARIKAEEQRAEEQRAEEGRAEEGEQRIKREPSD